MLTEFNLRYYIIILKRKWYLLVAGTIVAAFAAGVITSLIPETYKATALIIVTEPTDIVQFDERFRSLVENQPLRALPELAKSDQVLNSLSEKLDTPLLNDQNDVDDLRKITSAELGNDASLLRLTVQANTPEIAAEIANTWAETFVILTNELFRDRGIDKVAFFQDRLSEAEIELSKAESSLVDFEGNNRAIILDTTLTTYAEYQTDYLIAQRDVVMLLQDVKRLKNQLEQNISDGNFSEDLTVLILQLRSYNVQNSGPFLIELNSMESPISNSPSAQRQQIDQLITSLEAQSSFFDQRLEELDSLILDLQKERQEYVNEGIRLSRNFEISQETYTVLARKLEEERITSQDISSGLRLASFALPPQSPIGPRSLNAIVLTAIFGFILTALTLFATEWIKQEKINQ